MLRLLSTLGADLTATTPAPVTATVSSLTQAANVRVDCVVVQQDAVPYNNLSGTLNWNDGSPPAVYTGAGTLVVDSTRALAVGSYVVNLSASNCEVPVAQQLSVNFPVSVAVVTRMVPTVPLIYGPILPKDSGYPNSQQWSFDTGTDLEVIVSSLKGLLTTHKGERVMLPEYGTNLRGILFEFQSPGIVVMCQQEIVDALTKWEPRVTLDALTVTETAPREVTVSAVFTSRLNQQQFPLAVTFNV